MADLKQNNWADDDDYDSEEGQDEFGLDAAKSEPKQQSPEPKVSSFSNSI